MKMPLGGSEKSGMPKAQLMSDPSLTGLSQAIPGFAGGTPGLVCCQSSTQGGSKETLILKLKFQPDGEHSQMSTGIFGAD